MSGRVTVANGGVTLNGVPVPGRYRYFSVDRDIVIDEFQVPGIEGSIKKPVAIGDARAALELLLLDESDAGGETPEEQLAALDRMFSGKTGDGTPKVFRLYAPHAKARRLGEVLFSKLRSEDGADENSIRAVLEFEQYRPMKAQLARAAAVMEGRRASLPKALEFMASKISTAARPPDATGMPPRPDTLDPAQIPPLAGGAN